jgi:hypothetical protein
MALYRRGKIWWYSFQFQSRRIQESTGFTNKTAALRVEAKRKADLLDRRAGFTKAKLAPKFDDQVDKFLAWSKHQHRPNTRELHELNCKTLMRFFRGKYLDEITSEMVEDFKSARKQERIQWGKGTFRYGRDSESSPHDAQASISPGRTQWLFCQESRRGCLNVSGTDRFHASDQF